MLGGANKALDRFLCGEIWVRFRWISPEFKKIVVIVIVVLYKDWKEILDSQPRVKSAEERMQTNLFKGEKELEKKGKGDRMTSKMGLNFTY